MLVIRPVIPNLSLLFAFFCCCTVCPAQLRALFLHARLSFEAMISCIICNSQFSTAISAAASSSSHQTPRGRNKAQQWKSSRSQRRGYPPSSCVANRKISTISDDLFPTGPNHISLTSWGTPNCGDDIQDRRDDCDVGTQYCDTVSTNVPGHGLQVWGMNSKPS